MNLLIVGGAGYVGSILRPALEAAHRCRYLDLKPVPGAEDRTVVGSVNDDAAVARAVVGQEALLYLAMGTVNGNRRTVQDIDAAFDVNVQGLYRVLAAALAAGARRVCVASSLSVYRGRLAACTDETRPADAWDAYGMSKRGGEFICQAAAPHYPDATIVALRLILPRNDADWPASRYDPSKERNHFATGPEDIRRLFLKALELDRPGCHIVQATGDVTGTRLPNTRAHDLLGWLPENR